MIDALMASEVAGHCCGSLRTVIRWGWRGELEAYKLPGRGDYRALATEAFLNSAHWQTYLTSFT
jgi:hypothetical protein